MASDREKVGKNGPTLPVTKRDIPEESSIYGLRYISWGGGGVKGLGHWGAYKRFVETGVWANIDEVAGTSAGSIFALFTALGCSVEEVFNEMMQVNYKALQDRDTPGFIESSGIKPLLTFGEDIDPMSAAKKLLASKKDKGISEILGTAELLEDMTKAVLGPELGMWKGDALALLVTRIIIRKTKNPNLTFAQLAKLHEAHPEIFKKLTVVGANLSQRDPSQQKEYYSADDPKFKDMKIVDAIRISMSIPIAYRAVRTPITEAERQAGMGDVRVDGGVFENQPDVFNQGKYYTPAEGALGNPQAFAVSFSDPTKEETERTIKSGVGVIQALIQSKMTEVAIKAKFGMNIAYVDPKGVGTLDFDASEQQKIALANSGSTAVDQSFRAILSAEANKELTADDYAKMSMDELIRRRVAFDHDLKEKNVLLSDFKKQKELELTPQQISAIQAKVKIIPDRLNLIHDAIEKRTYSEKEAKEIMAKRQGRDAAAEFLPSHMIAEIERVKPEKEVVRKYTLKEIEEKANQEKERLQRRLKALGIIRPTVEDMKQHCERGLADLQAREKALRVDIEKLNWMELAIEWRRNELAAKFAKYEVLNENTGKLEAHNLSDNLNSKFHALAGHQKVIKAKQREIETLRSGRRSQAVKMTENEYADELRKLEEAEKAQRNEIASLFQGVQKTYEHDELMTDLLAEVHEEVTNNPNYVVPENYQYFQHELQEQFNEVQIARNELKEKLEELQRNRKNLNRQFELLSGKESNSDYYNNLKDFKMELDATLRSQLSWSEMKYSNRIPVADKLNRHWDQRPTFRNNIMGGLIKGLAFFGFTMRMTLGLGFLTMPIAYAVRRLSTTPETRRRADRFISAMSYPDFDKVRKLRGFSNKTADIIALLDKNYKEGREQETTYLYTLFSEHFKNSGFTFEEVFLRKASETDLEYSNRIKNLKSKFSKLLKEEGLDRVEDESTKARVNTQVENSKLVVAGKMLESGKKDVQDLKNVITERKRASEQVSQSQTEGERKGISEAEAGRLAAREVMLIVDRKLDILRMLSKPFSELDNKEMGKLVDYGIIPNTKATLSPEEIQKFKDKNAISLQMMRYYFESILELQHKIPADKHQFWQLVHDLLTKTEINDRALSAEDSQKQARLRNLYLEYVTGMKIKFPPKTEDLQGRDLQGEADKIKMDFRAAIDAKVEKAWMEIEKVKEDKESAEKLARRPKTKAGRTLFLADNEIEERRLVELYERILGSDARPEKFQRLYDDWLSSAAVSKEVLKDKERKEKKEGEEERKAFKLFVQFHKKLRARRVADGQKPGHIPAP